MNVLFRLFARNSVSGAAEQLDKTNDGRNALHVHDQHQQALTSAQLTAAALATESTQSQALAQLQLAVTQLTTAVAKLAGGLPEALDAGRLKVNTVRQTDRAAFADGSGLGDPAFALYNDAATAPSSGQAAAMRMTASRGLHVNLRNSAGIELSPLSNAELRAAPVSADLSVDSVGLNKEATQVVIAAIAQAALNTPLDSRAAEATQQSIYARLGDMLAALQNIAIDADSIAIDADTINLNTDNLENLMAVVRDRLPASLGQKVSAASLAAVLSTEQEAILASIVDQLTSVNAKTLTSDQVTSMNLAKEQRQNPLDRYRVADTGKGTTLSFYGFTAADGAWYLLREDKSVAGVVAYRYANASNNPSVTGYISGAAPAWGNRATLTYSYLHELTGI